MGAYRVLLTGGSKGIGKATAELFTRQGYEVHAPSHAELDLENRESIQAFLEAHGHDEYDVIINNAGNNVIASIDEIDTNVMDRMMAVNLTAPILLIRGLVWNMKQQRFGRIVNIGSIWAAVSKPGRAVYSVTKNGLHGLTQTLASELAPYNIMVNTVCPGFTLTELTRRTNTDEQIAQISRQIPIGRMAQPEEIAKMIFFAGCAENTYMTGQKIIVDGGFTSI